jgi:hypothetical protein
VRTLLARLAVVLLVAAAPVGVVGLYDPDTTTLYVRGTDLMP